jgi:hypothetical protein
MQIDAWTKHANTLGGGLDGSKIENRLSLVSKGSGFSRLSAAPELKTRPATATSSSSETATSPLQGKKFLTGNIARLIVGPSSKPFP